MAWRVAKSLNVLLDEINTIAPGRSTASDGSIGDDDHAASASDHNPNRARVVCARDFTHDPQHGADMHVLSRAVVKRRPRALKYVIWNRQIWSVSRAAEGWRPYYGVNPHTRHMHVSAGVGPDGQSTGPYDDTSPWGITNLGSSSPSTGAPAPTLRESDEGPSVGQLQRALNDALGLNLAVDEDYGPATTAAVRELQRRAGITTDGIYGRDAAAALDSLLEDDMNLNDKLPVTKYARETWGLDADDLDVRKAFSDGYVYDRNASDKANKIYEGQAVQVALLQQILAAASGLTEEQIATAVADGVRQAIPSAEELAAAVAAAVDHELDVAAAAQALREVLRGGVGE